MAQLFLDLDNSQTGSSISCESNVCLFIHNILKASVKELPYSVVLVKSLEAEKKLCFKYPVVKFEDCPVGLKFCSLPVLVSSGGRMIHCGLCSILRKLIKIAHDNEPELKLIKLLGHHEMCLRACAEVSLWTKFCEVEMLCLCKQLILRQQTTVENLKEYEIPKELLKLENHFKLPPVVPQIGKRKQEISAILGSSKWKSPKLCNWIDELNVSSIKDYLESQNKDDVSNRDKILKLLSSNAKLSMENNIPGLEHCFAEGVYVTLTDLILLHCVTQVLKYTRLLQSPEKASVPHILMWYKRMMSVDLLKSALQETGLSIPEVQGDFTYREDATAQLEDSSKLIKQKIRVSTTDAQQVLKSLESLDLSLETDRAYLKQNEWDWSDLPHAAFPSDLPESRVSRKCDQLKNVAAAVQSLARPGQVIVDFCAGSGHLGILVAYLLPQCNILLVENKEESIRRAGKRIEQLGLENVTLYQSNLDYFRGSFDIGMCLHACGVATDLVMNKCYEAQAAFVVCPCCYGSIQDTHTVKYPRSQYFNDRISYEEYLLLAHAADTSNTGKIFMNAVDQDRLVLAEQNCYRVSKSELKPATCSPKNNLLIGYKQTTCSLDKNIVKT